jgi:hypothetical protein
LCCKQSQPAHGGYTDKLSVISNGKQDRLIHAD